MSDIREQVLQRIRALMGMVEGIDRVYRNRGELTDDMLPAGILLDGNVEPFGPHQRHAGTLMAPRLMNLVPEIWFVIKPKAVYEEGIGEELSGYATRFAKLLSDDETLAVLLGTSGDIDPRGLSTDMQSGSSMEGQLKLSFAFTYLFDPNDL